MVDEKFELLKKKFNLKVKRDLARERLEVKLRGEAVKPPPPLTMPEGWSQLSEFVYARSLREPNPLDAGAWGECLLNPGGTALSDLLFFDVETTGLSGGAGNMIFLIGLGRIREDWLEIEQLFLADFPGEADFLSLLAQKLSGENLYVSYNGKGFDSHVIAARFLLNGRRIEFPDHLDLLYLCRRLWKKHLGSCALGDMERGVLGFFREGDVPGYQVPELYFSFLKSRRAGELEKVFYHNYEDIRALAAVLAHLVEVFAGKYRDPRLDARGLGCFLLERQCPRGEKVLAEGFEAGDNSAGLALAAYYKRREKWPEACGLWEEHHRRTGSSVSAREMAMYYEHRARDYSRALEWTERMAGFSLPEGKEKYEWEKRLNRLRGKIS